MNTTTTPTTVANPTPDPTNPDPVKWERFAPLRPGFNSRGWADHYGNYDGAFYGFPDGTTPFRAQGVVDGVAGEWTFHMTDSRFGGHEPGLMFSDDDGFGGMWCYGIVGQKNTLTMARANELAGRVRTTANRADMRRWGFSRVVGDRPGDTD